MQHGFCRGMEVARWYFAQPKLHAKVVLCCSQNKLQRRHLNSERSAGGLRWIWLPLKQARFTSLSVIYLGMHCYHSFMHYCTFLRCA
jgi:hypothetical protein